MVNTLNFPALSIPALAVVFISSVWLLLGRDWRYLIVALSLQYVGAFLLVALSWSIEMAVVKVLTGWMAGAVLGVGMAIVPSSERGEEGIEPSGRLFRLMAVGLVAMVVLSSALKMIEWLPGVGLEVVLGSLILIGNGLLMLGLTNRPFKITLGLLTLLSGFEILYAALEVSALVAGLLAGVNLGIALVGAFLMVIPSMEAAE